MRCLPAIAAVLTGAAVAVALAVVVRLHEPVVREVYGVVSPCGMYAAVVITDTGSVVVNEDNENDPEVAALIEQVQKLPHEKQHAIVVPCPSTQA